MIAGAAREPVATPRRRTEVVGATLLVLLALLTWGQALWTERLQSACFDAFQLLLPRPVRTLPVTVVEIDQRSLLAIGQWPWPRSALARLQVTPQATAAIFSKWLDLRLPNKAEFPVPATLEGK